MLASAGVSRTARPEPPGRSLDSASNGGARGMTVTPEARASGRRRTEFGASKAASHLDDATILLHPENHEAEIRPLMVGKLC